MKASFNVRELEAMMEPCLSFLTQNTDNSFPASSNWVLITSIEVDCEEELDTVLETLDMLLDENGISPNNTWGGFDNSEREKMKQFRHLLPETVNRLIHNLSKVNCRIHKISTDTAVPPERLQQYYPIMKEIPKKSAVEHVVFGHSGQGHLHANLLPKNCIQLAEAEKAVELIARSAVDFNGTVSAEHGTGKLKKHLLGLMYSEEELRGIDSLIESISFA
ncbi:MAG: hypothetical protein GY852_00635 [bacterium]|nr:hypothetical protein [bacterium]